MPHFGLLCPPVTGHLEPLAAVGRALIRRGHRVTFFHVPDMEAKARAAGLEFVALGREEYPMGALPESVRKLSSLSGMASLKFAVASSCHISELILKHGPDAFRRAQVDALLVDQNEPAAATVAEHLGIPFASVCTSLPLNREPSIPPPFVPWAYSNSFIAALRNRAGYAISDVLIAPIQSTLNTYRRKWNLRRVRIPDDTFSTAAQLAQMPREFDFPRTHPIANFHYTGPWFDEHSSANTPFPFDKLDGRPLIYGSLGTLQESNSRYFKVMAEACVGLNAQLVLSLGKPDETARYDLPGDPVVVNYAPQLELLRRAAVTITHGGMNTTQQSLYYGVPLVAIPLAHDQPAIASRLARCGAGFTIPPRRLTPARLRDILLKLLPNQNQWRDRAIELAKASRMGGGVERAAEIAEQVAGGTKSKGSQPPVGSP